LLLNERPIALKATLSPLERSILALRMMGIFIIRLCFRIEKIIRMMQSIVKKRKILQNSMKNNAKRMHIDAYSQTKVISCNGESPCILFSITLQ
ncbi:hypothetical protein NXX56_29045, partial [Bacteroides thetaiotaomicron]|nr:hypothetical protein [Bacteroides thetaiotaomicron]